MPSLSPPPEQEARVEIDAALQAAERAVQALAETNLHARPGVAVRDLQLKQGHGRPGVSFEQVRITAVATPPVAEQSGIVAEVERRLSVADQLEAAIARSLARAKRLQQVILKRAFDDKLVPQDPNDEPASALMERIRKEAQTRRNHTGGGNMFPEVEALRQEAASLERRLIALEAEVGHGQALQWGIEKVLEGVWGMVPADARRIGEFTISDTPNRLKELYDAHEQWHATAEATLSRISIARKNVTTQGNSRVLVKRLRSTRNYSRLATRIRKARAAIDGIAAEELVRNTEIPNLLRVRAERQLQKPKARGAKQVLGSEEDSPALRDLRRTAADVAERFDGAFHALASQHPDAPRQAMASARSALEAMAVRVTGNNYGPHAIRELPKNPERGLVEAAYHALSRDGIHNLGEPKVEEATRGIRLALEASLWLVKLPPAKLSR